MASTEYQLRLQRALDYVENHLESEISLADLAAEAGYSPGHFVWIFRTAIGQTPIEYVRGRKMTEAARAILSGEDIVDTVYRFGFSAQDAFTRSFRHTIGSPPGKLRQSGGTDGIYTTTLNLHQRKGGNKMLNYNLDCDALDSFLRIEQLLTDEVKELVARIAKGPIAIGEVDPHICDELIQARIIRVEGSTVKIDTAVFLEDDLEKIHGFADQWGKELGERINALSDRLPEMSPGYKRLLIGMNGIDQGVFNLLISEGYAFNHRATDGRYASAKIDFYELCDSYDRFGPYLSGGYGYSGERFAVKIIGHDQGFYRYLNSGISIEDDEQYAFRTNANKYLTDALGELLMGDGHHPSLSAAAEAAGLIKDGKVITPVITTDKAPVYWSAAKLVRDVISEFLSSTAAEMNNFMKDTLPGKQGVTPDKLIVDLMRYVRMVSHKSLYDCGFYTDSLPEGESITVFRELVARTDGK
ncbi:helix-turn-helix domain-containing protein [Chloroflexota bacterium]